MITAAATIATVPVAKKNGITGTIAPSPVEMPAAIAACSGSPPPPVPPNSSSGERLQHRVGVPAIRSASASAVGSSIPFSW